MNTKTNHTKLNVKESGKTALSTMFQILESTPF